MVCPSGTYPMYGFKSKADIFDASKKYWNPNKTQFWLDEGVDLIIGKREGYTLTDLGGHQVIDVHLNGGTFNLGHRNPELIECLKDALDTVDIGNHHFPASGRAAFAKALIDSVPGGDMDKVVFGSSGGEIVDTAIKSARYATGRRKIVSIIKAYHGHTGLAIDTGDERFLKLFKCDRPDEFVHVPFNDLEAMEKVLSGDDVAAVIIESIPATYGFPLPNPGYLSGIKELCAKHGSLYIADEVQTGLGRTVDLWCVQHHDVIPDILVTSKGLGGGLYPVSAVLLNKRAGEWLSEDGFAHMSTFGGAELGMAVGMKVLEITQRPETREHVGELSRLFKEGFASIKAKYPETLVEVRQDGVIAGLVFSGYETAVRVSKLLYDRGVWMIFATLDKTVLQFKAGLLLPFDQAKAVLDALEEVTALLDSERG